MFGPIEWQRAVKLLVLLASWQCTAGARAETAAEILAKTDVPGGLIVHLGCGDGQLTTALYAGDHYLVHGLSTKPTAVETTREAIRAAGRFRRISMRWKIA